MKTRICIIYGIEGFEPMILDIWAVLIHLSIYLNLFDMYVYIYIYIYMHMLNILTYMYQKYWMHVYPQNEAYGSIIRTYSVFGTYHLCDLHTATVVRLPTVLCGYQKWI